jgi:isobutyryl-CoA mutase
MRCGTCASSTGATMPASTMPDEALPIHATVASDFNDPGTNRLYRARWGVVAERTRVRFVADWIWWSTTPPNSTWSRPAGERYLAEIVEEIRRLRPLGRRSRPIWPSSWYRLRGAVEVDLKEGPELAVGGPDDDGRRLSTRRTGRPWSAGTVGGRVRRARSSCTVRGPGGRVPLTTRPCRTPGPQGGPAPVPVVGRPAPLAAAGERAREFPYTAGIYPLKRTEEDPTRMFAGEGPPEQTNRRFHYLAAGMPAKRLSTAFDSVTLYGEDPHERPDIYGKVGNSGVSVATLDDAKKLYSGFDLCDPATSVSMTINGPAPMILAFFLNAAIDQACEKYITEHGLEGRWRPEDRRDLRGDRPRPRYHGPLPDGTTARADAARGDR